VNSAFAIVPIAKIKKRPSVGRAFNRTRIV